LLLKYYRRRDMAKSKLRKDDYVMIIAGKDKGKTAQIISVDTENNRVFVEGTGLSTVNTKAVKARKANEKGGLVKMPGSVDISNVLPVCAACNKPTRIGVSIVDGNKVRVCKKCGEVLVTKKASAKAAAKATVRKKTAVKKADAEVQNTEVIAPVTETATIAPVEEKEVKKTTATVRTKKKVESADSDKKDVGNSDNK
jgi:large subunit ribosomal protein L24